MIRPFRSRTASLAAPPARLSAQARLALLTGGVMLASMSVSSLGLLSARADEKSERRQRNYNIGAGVLAGAAIYYGVKKRNPIGAAAAGAGAYYAYKKGKEAGQKSKNDRYGYNNPYPGVGTPDAYPDDNGYSNGGYPVGAPGGYDYGNGGYPVGAPGGYDYGDGNGSYPQDVDGGYGYGTGGDYAQTGDAYPDYGLDGLRNRRSDSKSKGPKSTAQRSRRITVK